MLQLPNKKYDTDYKVNFNFYQWKDGHFTETVKFLVFFIREQIVPSFYTLLNVYHLCGKRKKRHEKISKSSPKHTFLRGTRKEQKQQTA